MTFARGVFIFAFLMLIVGAVGARFILGPLLFGDSGAAPYSIAVRAPVPTPTPHKSSATQSIPQTTRTRTQADAAARTITPLPSPTPTFARMAATRVATPTKRVSTPTPTVTPAILATVTPTAEPSPTPSGVVSLSNYWVGSTSAAPGSTIEVGYTIDNATGRTERIELGASVKGAGRASWATGSISDPGHDVVAVVPPGISNHVRYFTLSSAVRAGAYDVAWGLRAPGTNDRVALVAASSVLRVRGIVPAP